MDAVEKEQLPMRDCFDSSRAASLRNGGFVANDFMPLKHGSDIDFLVAIHGGHAHSNDFSGGSDQHFGAAGDFGRKNYREIQLVASAEIIVDGEIDTPRRNVPGLAGQGGGLFIIGRTNKYG
jgi:hypothetical protein